MTGRTRPGALAGRIALVTGASSGLGEATAVGLARLGARVHLLVRNAEKGEQSRNRIAEQVPGAELVGETCDIGELDDVRRFVGEFPARVPELDVVVHGWAATPGVTGSIPAFGAVVGPALRTVEQGADTAVWLAAAPSAAVGTGRFWHDRELRPAHYVPWTRESPADRRRFWENVNALV